ncbi:MAG TPA: VOC family protein [Kofleriaceae bacterium]|jgi:catechol 2,3-dioxygenase-like lactoylglutathione lyase family enzyme|nr:VOC family protein [Kofleriaceae bacterium]
MIVRIDHVQLAIPPGGEDLARAFYIAVLGLHEVPKPEAMRARGGMWFAEGIHLGIEPDMRPSAKMHPALVVDDLAALEATLAAAGCEFIEAHDQPGVRRGHTRDPFGNRIELVAGM